jgi:flavin reductase (DIM6/NTAB) family NADH-FMN oxidoreductase RutF
MYMVGFLMEDIQGWDRFYRAHFIHSLSGFKSASLIATTNKLGRDNLAIFSNIVHLGADPALVGFINRPKEAAPHTIANIEAMGEYTINLITAFMVKQAHQTSAKYAEGVSEFEMTELTPERLTGSKIPFVKESPVKYALQLKEIVPIKHNNTFFVIGAITAAYVPAEIIGEDGFIDLSKANIITSLGIDTYYATNQIDKLNYAKP